jgi:two-component system, NtrC family, nitrogen regulation response regulator GlnG
VRQLENVCHWLTVMAPTQVIDEKDLPPEVLGEVSKSSSIITTDATQNIAARASFPWAGGSFSSENTVSNATEGSHTVSAGHGAPGHSTVPAFSAGIAVPAPTAGAGWEAELTSEVLSLLAKDKGDVWDALTQRFERQLIAAALSTTRGRRIEAAVKLGIGRNTITRKIAELGLE